MRFSIKCFIVCTAFISTCFIFHDFHQNYYRPKVVYQIPNEDLEDELSEVIETEDVEKIEKNNKVLREDQKTNNKIPLVTTACGLQANEDNQLFRRMRVFLKSLALFSEQPVDVIIIMNENLDAIEEIVKDWPKLYRDKLNLTVIPTWFPAQENTVQYLFKKCSAQKLLFLEMPFFRSVDSLIYYDNDIIFLNSLSRLFEEFRFLRAPQSMGVCGISTGRCSPRFIVKKPCFNAGMYLLNLTSIRTYSVNVTKEWMDIRHDFGRRLHGDQDLLNIFWTRYPDIYKKLSVEWNFDWNGCYHAREVVTGVSTLHGTGLIFFRTGGYEFKSLFQFFESWNMNASSSLLVVRLEESLREVINSNETVLCKDKTKWKELIMYYPRRVLLQKGDL